MKVRQRRRRRTESENYTLFRTALMHAPLQTSLVLQKGAGGPSYTRATKAWRFDELGLLKELPSGCAEFVGARLVRNTVRTKSEDFSIAGWSKTALTVSGTNTIICNNSTSLQYITQSSNGTAVVTGEHFLYGIRAEYIPGGVEFIQIKSGNLGFGSDFINVSLIDGTYISSGGVYASVTNVSPGVYDINLRAVADASVNGDYFAIYLIDDLNELGGGSFVGDGIKSFNILRSWGYNVTGYPLDYIPEYVSVGVASTPWFGAGIDGAKYFSTDYSGQTKLSGLLGFRRDVASTNSLLRSRKFSNPGVNDLLSGKAWVSSATVGSELITNGGFDADTNWTKTAEWTISGGVASCASGTTATISQDLTGLITAGKTYTITYTVTRSAGTVIPSLGSTSTDTGGARSADGTYTDTIVCGSTNLTLYFYGYGSFTGTIDNVSIKESAVQITTTTGLDGLSNSATRLTASANDATMTQSLILATATRCASAYVKRVSGTGSIFFTLDGTNWTDITSSINSSGYTRVYISASVTDPIVGFKIGTSGDVIDVDCLSCESNVMITSPIVTTTAAVTRNVDTLVYETTSNIDFSVGSLSMKLSCPTSRFLGYGASTSPSGRMIYSTNSDARLAMYDGVNIAQLDTTAHMNGGFALAASSWSTANSQQKISVDGVTPNTTTFDGDMGSGTSIQLGSSGSGTVHIGDVRTYGYAMTDAQLQSVSRGKT